MYFILKTNALNVNIQTDEKYVFISGFSGAGKSLFISEVERTFNISGSLGNSNIKSDYDYYVISNRASFEGMAALMAQGNICIFLADEFYANKVAMAIQDKNAYCICVTRKPPKNINFSYKSLYRAERNAADGVTEIVPAICIEQGAVLGRLDKIIVEDSKSGFQYFETVLDKIPIISARGKSNISAVLLENNIKESVLVIFDAAGIGSDIGSIKKVCIRRSKFGGYTHLCMPECFEQILANAKMLSHLEHGIFEPKYNNLENFYESEIERLTKDTVLEYTHKKQELSKCWVENCGSCDEDCAFRVEVPKVRAVLESSQCEILLHFVREELL